MELGLLIGGWVIAIYYSYLKWIPWLKAQVIKIYFLAAACKARSISLYGCAPNMRLPSAKIKVGVLVISNDLAKSPTFSRGTSQLTAFLGS